MMMEKSGNRVDSSSSSAQLSLGRVIGALFGEALLSLELIPVGALVEDIDSVGLIQQTYYSVGQLCAASASSSSSATTL